MDTQPLQHKQNNLLNGTELDHQLIEVATNPYNRIEVINEIDEFLALRDDWNQINDDSLKGTIFNSWEWMYTWWETYKDQGKRRLYLLTCTNIHNQLLGIAPFQIVNNPKKYFPCNRQILMLGTGETDGTLVFGEYSDLVIKLGHEQAVINAFTHFLNQQSNLWDGIKFQQQLCNSHLSKLFDTTSDDLKYSSGKQNIKKSIVEDGFRTYIDLPETYRAYLMSLRKKMRNNITRTYSRLESEQEFIINTVTTDSEVNAQILGQDSAIETLAKLNRIRRDDMDQKSVFSSPSFEMFHSRLVKRLLPQNKVSLRIMCFNHEPVAALYSYIDKDTLHAYQSGFETENGHRYSLLTTMLTQQISNSIENEDITRFNFMYSDEESTYKRRYSGTTEKMFNIAYDKQGLKYSIHSFIHQKLKGIVKQFLNIK